MVIGGFGGGALGIVLHRVWPELAPHPASFVIVGMAGFFAAAAKTPFSTLVMVSEMTGNYNLLLPTLWVCSLAFLFSDELSIYSSQVVSRALSPAHKGNYVREVLTGVSVGQFVSLPQDAPTLAPGDGLPRILEQFRNSSFHVLPVTDVQGHFLGVVSMEEVHLASQSRHIDALIVANDLMRSDVTPLKSRDSLDHALELFVENDQPELPLVDDGQVPRVIGIVRRSEISRAYLRYLHGDADGNQRADYTL